MNNLFKSFKLSSDEPGLIVPSISKYSAWPTIRRDPNNGNLLLVYTEKNHHVSNSSRLILLTYNIKDKEPFWTKKELAYSLPDSIPNHNALPKGGSITTGYTTKKVIVTWGHSNNYYYKNTHPSSDDDWHDIRDCWDQEYKSKVDVDILQLIYEWINECKVDYPELVDLISGGCANPDGNIKIGWHELIDISKPYLPIENPHPRIPSGAMHGGIELGNGKFLFVGGEYFLTSDDTYGTGIIAEIEDYRTDKRIFLKHLSIIHKDINNNNLYSLKEPSLVEYFYNPKINNSNLLVVFRNEVSNEKPLLDYGFYSSRSINSGVDWSPPTRLSLKYRDENGNERDIEYYDSDAPEIIKLNDGRLLLTFSSRRDSGVLNKCKIYTSISTNSGVTWETAKLIASFDSHPSNCGCPSSVQLEDNSIITVWYQSASCALCDNTYPLDMTWLYARKWIP